MDKKIKVLIHFTHKHTLGHTSRIFTLANALIQAKRAAIEVHILQAGSPQLFIKPSSHVHLHQIPSHFDQRDALHDERFHQLLSARKDYVFQKTCAISPHIFITEFFPFGRLEYAPELITTLQYLKKQKIPIVCSLGYPYFSKLEQISTLYQQKLIKNIFKLYQCILIHTPRRLENAYMRKSLSSPQLRRKHNRLFNALAPKTFYTGYIFPDLPLNLPTNPVTPHRHHKKIILVSRGAGIFGSSLIINAIRAQQILGGNFHTIIISGPETPKKEKIVYLKLIQKMQGHNITFFDAVPSLLPWLCSCDVSVSLCGYNTSVQLLKHGIPSIVLPYPGERQRQSPNDQTARALLLEDQLKSTILPLYSLSPEVLAQSILEKISNPQRPSPAPKSWFNGTRNSAKILLDIIKCKPLNAG